LYKFTLNRDKIQLGFWSFKEFNYWTALKRDDARQWAQAVIQTK